MLSQVLPVLLQDAPFLLLENTQRDQHCHMVLTHIIVISSDFQNSTQTRRREEGRTLLCVILQWNSLGNELAQAPAM